MTCTITYKENGEIKQRDIQVVVFADAQISFWYICQHLENTYYGGKTIEVVNIEEKRAAVVTVPKRRKSDRLSANEK